MSLLDLQPNIPVVDMSQYVFVIAGIPKIGKTTLFADIVRKHFKNPRKALLLSCEPGAKALAGVISKPIDTWSDFTNVIDELISQRTKMPFDFVGVDTVDALVEICGKQVVREHNRDNPENRVRDYEDIDWGGGSTKIRKKVEDQLVRLVKAGYGLFVITHSQEKKVTQKNGVKFDQLQPSLPGKTGTAIENMADFIIFITSEREVDGSKTRWMHFRDDGYIRAGSRFPNVPDRVEYGVENLVKVFEDAVKASFEGVDVSITDAAKEQAETKQKSVEEFVQSETQKNVNPSEIIEQIDVKVKAMDPARQKEIAAKFRDIAGTAKYNTVTDVDVLVELLNACA
jgi:hypothetical protein